jgi:D-glycero-D-manno-heptose 1,7-bisphosphate phosphatase
MTTAFLDRDGVINEKPQAGRYITTARELRLLPGAAEAIRLLNEAQVRVIVVTNQRGVALGVMSMEQLQGVHHHMVEELQRAGAHVDAIYACPHAEDSCDCRKPGIGLFLRAKSEFTDIMFDEVYVIGDSDRDMEAGRRLGARLIRIGQPTSPDESGAPALLEAVNRYFVTADRKSAL